MTKMINWKLEFRILNLNFSIVFTDSLSAFCRFKLREELMFFGLFRRQKKKIFIDSSAFELIPENCIKIRQNSFH